MGLLVLAVPCVSTAQHMNASSRGPVDAAFFDLNIHGMTSNTHELIVPFVSWRVFHFNWKDLEPEKDVWDFARTDSDVQQASQRGLELLAILQTAPRWAANPHDPALMKAPYNPADPSIPASEDLWAEYVRTVATRYKGKIHLYELWNEPDMVPQFSRNPEALTRMNQIAYNTLKSVDPSIQVISSALSCGDADRSRPLRHLHAFLQAGAIQVGDIIAYHFYAPPRSGETEAGNPESLLGSIAALEVQLAGSGQHKQLWATEIGWSILNDDHNFDDPPSWMGKPVTPDTGAAYLARMYILGWAAGLSRIYWYAWRDEYFGMTEANGAPKAPEIAFGTIQKWLLGATLRTCDRNSAGVWTCKLTEPNRKEGVILWSENRPASVSLDPEWHVDRAEHLDGSWSIVKDTLAVGIDPVLLVP